MATSAISAGDQTKLRSGFTIPRLDVFYVQEQTVATATITAVPPLTPYTYVDVGSTSGWSDIDEGMLVRISNSGTLRCYTTVSGAGDSDTLEIGATYTGSPGYPQLVRTAVQVGDSVEVINSFPQWGLYPTITSNGVFLKNMDDTYSDQNISPPPLANSGVDQGAKIAVGGSATFTLPKSGSNTSYSLYGATPLTYAWTLPTGVTLGMGYNLTDAVIEVSATQGRHTCRLVVTDVNSKVSYSYVNLHVADGANYLSLDQAFSITEVSLERGRVGTSGTITLEGNNIDLLPATDILIQEPTVFDGGALSSGVLEDTNSLIVSEVDITHDGEKGTVILSVVSPSLYAQKIVQQPQYTDTVTGTPTSWVQVSYGIVSPTHAAYYAMKWHAPNILRRNDFDPSNSDYDDLKGIAYDYGGSSLYDAMDFAAKKIVGQIGCDPDGTITLRSNPIYRDNATRNARAVLMTLDAIDYSRDRGGIKWKRNNYVPVREIESGSIAIDSALTVIPTYAKGRWEQGTAFEQRTTFWTYPTSYLAETLSITGHMLAEANAPFDEIQVAFAYNMDIFRPNRLDWVRANVATAYDPTGAGLSSIRTLPKRVQIKYTRTNRGIEKTVDGFFQPETFGQPAEQYIPASSAIFTLPYYVPPDLGNDSIPTILGIVDDIGNGATTNNSQGLSPKWVNRANDAGIVGTFCDWAKDWNSGGVFDSGSNLGVYVTTISSDTVYLYYITNLYADAWEATEVETFTLADTTATTNARVEVSIFNPSYVAVIVKDGTGTQISRSDDGGLTFESLVRVGSSISDNAANDNAMIGAAWDFDYLIVSAPNSSNEYQLYEAQDTGSFSLVGGTNPVYLSPHPSIRSDSAGGVVASAATLLDDIYSIPFGGVDHTSYSFSSTAAGNMDVTEETSGGNPSDCMLVNVHTNIVSGTRQTASISIGGLPSGGYLQSIRVNYKFATNTTARTITALSSPSIDVDIVDFAAGEAPTSFSSTTKAINLNITSTTLTLVIYVGHLAGSGATIDNIVLNFLDGTEPRIYRVDDFAGLLGTPTWTNITPESGHYARFPHGISIDDGNSAVYDAMCFDGVNTHWYKTINSGVAWSLVSAEVPYSFVERRGDFVILAGDNAIGGTINEGATVASKVGNLAGVESTLNIIKRVVYP